MEATRTKQPKKNEGEDDTEAARSLTTITTREEEKTQNPRKNDGCPSPSSYHPMFAAAFAKKKEEEKEDARRVAEATIDLTKKNNNNNDEKDIQKNRGDDAREEEEGGGEAMMIVDLTQEEEEKTTTISKPSSSSPPPPPPPPPPPARPAPKKVHSFFQKRKPTTKSSDNAAAMNVPGVSRKTPYEEAVKNLPPIHVNCPVRRFDGAETETIALETAVAFAAERGRSLSKSPPFRWQYEIKSDDEKKEERKIEVEEEEEEPNDEYSRAILNRLESQFRAASKGTPWVEICKPTRASETLGSQNSQPADLCRNWLTNWKARIESKKNASKHTFRNARRQHKSNNQHSDSEDSDAKWEREMGMELSDDDYYEGRVGGEKNDGFGDGSGANIANGLIVFGDSGSGKTATIRAVASELGFSILEVNAGQNRTGRDILERFGESLQSKNLLNKRKKSSSGATETFAKSRKEAEETMVPSTGTIDANATTTSEEPKKKKKTSNGGTKAQKTLGNKTLLGFVNKKVTTNGAENVREKEKKENEEGKGGKEKKQQQNSTVTSSNNNNNNNNTVVVFEDIDCLFSNEDEEAKDVDRGLVPAIATLLEAAKRPIIVVCKSEEALDGDDGQLRQLTSLGTSTTRVGFEKPSVEELAKYLRLCCLAQAKASRFSPSEGEQSSSMTSKRALTTSRCLEIAKFRSGDIRGALNDCEVFSAAGPGGGRISASKDEKYSLAVADDETTNDFLFDNALPLLSDAYSNGILPVKAVAFTEKISKEYEANENALVAKYAETSDARFLEYSLKENEKREKAKAERRKKKLEALGLKESQVDPDISAWKDLEGEEEEKNKDNSPVEEKEEEEEEDEKRQRERLQNDQSVKCTPVKSGQGDGEAMEVEEDEDNNNDGDVQDVKEDGVVPYFSEQNLDIPPSPLTSAPEVAEASVESAEFWATHVQRMTEVSNLSTIQSNFDALMRPKPFGSNGVPLSLKPGVLARCVDYCDAFDSDTKETQFVDEDFLLTGGEPRKQFGDERKRVSSQCVDVGLQRFREKIVGTVLQEGFTDAAAIDFIKRAREEGDEKATSKNEKDILLRQREFATLLNPKLESSNSVSLASYVGFASKIAKARFKPTALDTPGKTRTRRAKLSMHLDKFVGVREQEQIASLSNFNR